MKNLEAAAIFYRIAELLELKNDNPFKIRSYRKAAQVLEALTEDLAEIHRRGGVDALREIPGVGEAIAKKIEEILATGKLSYYEELKAAVPQGLVALLSIPEVGPKTARLLHEKLKVEGIEELEKAAREGKVRELPGMGTKSEENILRGIELLRKGKERLALGVAYPIAQSIVAELKDLPAVLRIDVAGSLRRMRETIGDIDILAASCEPVPVMERFTTLAQVKQVLARGKTKSSLIVEGGVQVDLRVVEPESFGAALQYFTGSKEHNIRLRELAVRRGLKINEYGVFEVESGKRIAGAAEEEVYAALKLPWVPPELREDRGEIEAAQEDRLPRLVELADLRGDLHAHTRWSDGGHSLLEMAEAARGRGYRYLAVTDHSQSLKVAGGLSVDRLKEQIREIRKLNEKLGDFRLLAGIEVDIKKDGSLDFEDKLLAQLEVVIAAVHSGFKMEAQAMTERILKAIANPYVNILAHPSGRIIGQREPYSVDMERLIRGAADTGTFLEINAFPERLDLKDTHARRAKELGVPISLGTDAHNLMQLDLMAFGVATARRGWLEAKDLLNSLPVDKLLEKLARKRS